MGKFISRDVVVEQIKQAQQIVLLTHNDPDGDGLGSQLALMRGLKKLGKLCRILNVGHLQNSYRWMIEEAEAEFFKRGGPYPDSVEADLFVCLDFNGWERLLGFEKSILSAKVPTVVVDHHPSNNPSADFSWVDPSYAATGLMVLEILKDLRVELDESIATPLWVSFITDTGHFRFSNTSKYVLESAGEMVRYGVRPADVHKKVFEGSRIERLKLLGSALLNVQTSCSGRLAWIIVDQDLLSSSGAISDETEGFMDVLRTLDTLEVGVMFRVTADQKVKVHMRSRGDLDISKFAQSFGGGGHKRAAGITFDDNIEIVVDMVTRALEKQIEK